MPRAPLLALLVVAGCGDNVDDLTPDAAIDAPMEDASMMCSGPLVPTGCAADGLAAIDLDGAWTITGTRSDHGTIEAYTSTLYLAQMGTGPCSFAFSTSPISPSDPLKGYSNGTVASYALDTNVPHVVQIATTLCARDGDGALLYRSRRYVSMPSVDEVIEGLLTR